MMGTATATKRQTQEEAFIELEGLNGHVTTDHLIEHAKDVTSPWHDEFVWDIKAAAYEAWTDTARKILRRVVLQIERRDIIIETPRFVHDPELGSGENGYISILKIKRSKTARQLLMEQEMSRAIGNLRRSLNIALAIGEDEIAGAIQKAIKILEK